MEIGGESSTGKNVELRGYTDADWAGDRTDRRSTSGYIITMNGGVLSEASTKQRCTALSSREAEYVGLSECCRAIQRAGNLIMELGEGFSPSVIYEDNQGCTALIKASTKCAKHIEIRYYYARRRVTFEELLNHPKMPIGLENYMFFLPQINRYLCPRVRSLFGTTSGFEGYPT